MKAFCERCHKGINEKKESYFRIETFEKGKKIKVGWLHKSCNIQMTDEREETKETLKVAKELASRLNDAMGQMGFETAVPTYEVK